MTKTNRRKFLTTAASTAIGALLSGIVKAEKPVPVEDIQAVPLGAGYVTGVDWSTGPDLTAWAVAYRDALDASGALRIEFIFQ